MAWLILNRELGFGSDSLATGVGDLLLFDFYALKVYFKTKIINWKT